MFNATHIAALGNDQDKPRIRRLCVIVRPADVPGMSLVRFEDNSEVILPNNELQPIPLPPKAHVIEP